jgi:DNA topoisomerase-3
LPGYEFGGWFAPINSNARIIVTSTIGHVYGLDFDENRTPDIADLFHAKVKKTIEPNTAKNHVVEHLKELAEECEYLALWLDCDREGENICYEVISICGTPPENIYRAFFSALTEPEMRHAFNNLGRPDKNLALSVDARQELDLKIGCAFTRLMTRTFMGAARKKFRLRDDCKCLSYGPCQTPTLWFCVERHHEIKNWDYQEYHMLKSNVLIEGSAPPQPKQECSVKIKRKIKNVYFEN